MVMAVGVVADEVAHRGTGKYISGRMAPAAETSDPHGRCKSRRDDRNNNRVRKLPGYYLGERKRFDGMP